MVSPNVNFNFPASAFIFIGAIALSYFSHVGWWALAGLFYFLYPKIPNDVLSYISLSIGGIFFFIGILNMGWAFF
jgi:hypothetical protein